MLQHDQHTSGTLNLAWLFLALAAFMACTGSALAQESGVEVAVAGLTPDGWPEAQAVVTVLDADGRPVAGLAEGDFTVRLNGELLPVRTVSQGVDSTLAIDVVLALDVSGSMGGGALDQAKLAARDFLDGLSPDDHVAVVAFSDTVIVIQPFTQDRGLAAQAIGGLVADGETTLYQATSESIQLAAGAGSGRQAVVLLSDGVDNGSASSRRDALAIAETMGVPVIAIGLGADIDRAYLEALAKDSGGRFAAAPSAAGLAEVYQQAAELLRGQYVLTLDASELQLDRSEVAALRVDASVAGTTSGAERLVCTQPLCVTLLDLEAGERLTEERTVVAQIVATDSVASVVFSIDGEVAKLVTEPPYEFVFAPHLLPDGEHSLGVEATTSGSEAVLREITVRTGAAGGGGVGGAVMIGAVIGAALAAAALVFLYVRRGGGGEEEGLPDLRPEPPSPDPASGPSGPVPTPSNTLESPLPTLEESLGRLVVTNGPLAGKTFDVSSLPLSIGSGLRCRIRIPEGSEGADRVGVEHTRVWVRDGRLMVHELRRLTSYGAMGGNWQILTTGDAFTIGTTTVEFTLLGSEAAESSDTPNKGVPNILRERDEPPSKLSVTRTGGGLPLNDEARFESPAPAGPWQKIDGQGGSLGTSALSTPDSGDVSVTDLSPSRGPDADD